jgi:hypothetical protein
LKRSVVAVVEADMYRQSALCGNPRKFVELGRASRTWFLEQDGLAGACSSRCDARKLIVRRCHDHGIDVGRVYDISPVDARRAAMTRCQ